ncbi:peptide-binding protein [Pseudoxanthomonas yeongjuensis]|uniref:aspartyl protease family protein n=1 Tax=Pseudoxanthomonas yeongjuensis TaxID=377616 RepID=UPI0013917641|nr:aspartyl protease family protein [Pseudoxanthomonas yeongjuensis]KAF1716431.1 peptide-binding protein [Pseudoxanthomonas yeongjuensis]
MRFKLVVLGMLLAVAPIHALGQDAATVLARAKASSGGPRWEAVHSLQIEGEKSAGGLAGAWRLTQDLDTGRHVESSRLGKFELAHGYDGQRAWRRDHGGEIGLLDGIVPRRNARTQAWLAARAYWYAERMPASYAPARSQTLEGRRYDIVAATPEGGDPLELWFDAGSGLLTRIVLPVALGSTVSLLGDYRDVDGLRLPHRITTDNADSAGRSDPRLRSELQVHRYRINTAPTDPAFAPPPMPADGYVDDKDGVTHVPFDLVNNHVYVDAKVDGQPARFLVDTGAVNLLTPSAAKRLGISSAGKLSINGAGDNAVELSLAQARHLQVGDAHLPRPVFYVIDLGQQLNSMGVHYDGFIGYETFRRFVTTFDYAARVLSFAEPSRYRPPSNAVALTFEQDDRAPVLSGTLDGIPLRLWIDSGSRGSLSLNSPFVRSHGLLEKYRAGGEAVLGWGIGGPARAHPARLGVLSLGGIDVEGLAGDLSTTDKGALAISDYGAILGGGVLRRFTVGLDYGAKRMYLTPNAENAAPEPFDRSGLWLQADGSTLRVGDVAAGSAAERAQLRENDRIVSIRGEQVTTRGLGQWREILRELPPGTRVAVGYLRDGKHANAELILSDRIPRHWPSDGSMPRGAEP